MSEKLDRRKRDFSKFDSMTTEQLQRLLRLDAMKPEGEESDTEELFYIMGVLADRRRNDSDYTGKTAQQAFEDFEKYYMSEDAAATPVSTAPVTKNKPSVRWLRRLTAVAAVFAIVFLTTLTANAFGFDLFGKVAKWSADIFHFEGAPEATISPVDSSLNEFSSLQQALTEHRIFQNLAPTRLPNNYTVCELKISENPHEKVFFSKYINKNNEEMTITIRQILVGVPFSIEKNDDFVEVYESEGIAYYLFSNYDRIRAVWVIDEFECMIAGNISIEVMKDIIDSI